jgi:polar amino acid transport system substrate-binding protein
VETLNQNVKKVHAGRDDMFAATELGGWAIINKYYANEIYNFAASKKPIYHISADIIFADDQQYLSEIFKEGLDIIKKNGTYLSIVENYYGSRGVPEQILKFIENP